MANQISNKIDTMVKTTVGAIIEKDRKILVIKRNVEPFKGSWAIPGGHIEKYETAAEAVKREIKEETDLNVQPTFLFYIDEINSGIEPKFDGHSVVLVFYAKTNGKARINEESSEFKWVRPEEAVRLKLGFSNSKIIRKWMGLKV